MGGIIAGMPTTAIIIGIPVRVQLEGEAEAYRKDPVRAAVAVVTEGVIRLEVIAVRLQFGTAVDVGVRAHGHRYDARDAEIPEGVVLSGREFVIVVRAQTDLDRDSHRR